MAFLYSENQKTALRSINQDRTLPDFNWAEAQIYFLKGWRAVESKYAAVRVECEKDPRKDKAWKTQQLRNMAVEDHYE